MKKRTLFLMAGLLAISALTGCSGGQAAAETVTETAEDHGFTAIAEENMLYISVMNHLFVDCDCDGNPADPDMHDIGILASLDPVAVDQACVDLVYAAEDGASLIERIETRHGVHTLDYAAEIGIIPAVYAIGGLCEVFRRAERVWRAAGGHFGRSSLCLLFSMVTGLMVNRVF